MRLPWMIIDFEYKRKFNVDIWREAKREEKKKRTEKWNREGKGKIVLSKTRNWFRMKLKLSFGFGYVTQGIEAAAITFHSVSAVHELSSWRREMKIVSQSLRAAFFQDLRA